LGFFKPFGDLVDRALQSAMQQVLARCRTLDAAKSGNTLRCPTQRDILVAKERE
jgi:hypothetical protein